MHCVGWRWWGCPPILLGSTKGRILPLQVCSLPHVAPHEGFAVFVFACKEVSSSVVSFLDGLSLYDRSSALAIRYCFLHVCVVRVTISPINVLRMNHKYFDHTRALFPFIV